MKLMGHRGARDRAPENTMRSFVAAIESGVPAVELDIHEVKDGVWVVHHDDTLDRTTTSTGRITEQDWSTLSKVRTKEGDTLPRLEDVLELFAKVKTELQIEIKSPGDLQKLGATLQSFKEQERLTMISFNHRWLKTFNEKNQNIKTTALLFGLPVNATEVAKAAKADGLSLSVGWIDEQLVQEAHAANLTVTAWNANDLSTFQRMKAIGVDCLGTDVPFTAMQW